MKPSVLRLLAVLCALQATDALAEEPARGPTIALPPEASSPVDDGTPEIGVAARQDTLTRGLEPARMSQSHTVVGGYGQFGLNALKVGPSAPFDAAANVRRVVLFVAHPLTDDIRVYTEFEWENALACSSCQGSAEIEQAFLQWRLLGDALALRVGLVLVPMGIINQWHEPPVFHGVERPNVDTFVIPTTWRELGAGITGTLLERLHYELYLTTTLNPMRLNENATTTGLQSASMLGSLAKAKAFAVTGRIEAEPMLGFITGASFFASNLGPNGAFFNAGGKKKSLVLPLFGYALDARIRRAGIEARAIWSQFFLTNADALIDAYGQNGSPLFPVLDTTMGSVPMRIQGGYLELAYNVFELARVSHELFAFVRLETYDTQAKVPSGRSRNPARSVDELTAGLTYRPIPQLAFKGDVQLRDRRLGLDEIQVNLGFGYMF